jgi:hypothetical protein
VQSAARTVPEYLASLPPDRRTEISVVRRAVRRALPSGYEEVMNWGMITWQVPLRRYADTRNGQPLCYAALAAQKNYNALYLMGCYVSQDQLRRLRRAFDEAGKRMDMGKSCLRFKEGADLPLEAIGALLAEMPPDVYIALSEQARASSAPARKVSKRATRSGTVSARKRAAAPGRRRS